MHVWLNQNLRQTGCRCYRCLQGSRAWLPYWISSFTTAQNRRKKKYVVVIVITLIHDVSKDEATILLRSFIPRPLFFCSCNNAISSVRLIGPVLSVRLCATGGRHHCDTSRGALLIPLLHIRSPQKIWSLVADAVEVPVCIPHLDTAAPRSQR